MQQQKGNPGTGARSRRHIQEELGSTKGEASVECQFSEFALTRSTKQLGAIHGYVLSAWAMAGIFGPQAVARLYEATGSYETVLHVFSGLCAVALAVSILMTMYMLNARNRMTGGDPF